MMQLATTLALLAWVCIGAVEVVHLRGRPQVQQDVLLDEHFAGGTRPTVSMAGSWVQTPHGLALGPGGHGTLALDIPIRRADAPLVVRLWLSGRADLPIEVACRAPDGRSHLLRTVERDVTGAPVDLSDCGLATPALRVTVSAASAASTPHLVVDRLQASSDVSPRVPPAAWQFSLGLVLIVAAAAIREPHWWTVAAAGAAGALGAWALPPPGPDYLNTSLLAHLPLLALGLVPMLRAPVRCLSAGLAVGALALTTRWHQFVVAGAAVMPPDATTVASLATGMTHLYDTAFREPLWVWVGWLMAGLTRQPLVGLQLFSVLTSALLAPLGLWVALRVTRSLPIALVTGVLLAVHPTLVHDSPDGLRTTFNAAVPAVAVGLASLASRRWRWGLASLVMAAGAGMQVSSLSVVVLLLLLVWWRRRTVEEFVGLVALPLVLTAVLLAPHLVNNARVYGDPLFSVNYHGVFYRNLEFVRRGGGTCPGCPTLEELDKDSYAGSPVTVGQYIFGLHPVDEVIRRVVVGYASVYAVPERYLGHLLGSRDTLLVWSYGIGLLLLVWRRCWLPLVALVVPLNMLAFLVPIGLDPRLVMTPVVFVALATAMPLAAVMMWGLGRRLSDGDVPIVTRRVG